MDLIANKPCIISCGVGGWYPAGIDRMERSLIFHGYGGDMLFWRNEYPPDCPSHQDNPYAFKIYAFREAFRRGYNIVVWLDCSLWATKNPMNIMDIVNEKGIFAFRSGYNCAQTCTDALLSEAGYSRDEAENLPEIATGIVGINISNPDGKKVFDLWAEYCDKGLFRNSRTYNADESLDPRYLHGRQDQAAYSVAVHKSGVVFDYQDYVAYYGTGHNPEKLTFWIGGL